MEGFVNSVDENEKIKNMLINFMEENNISYKLIECCSCERICLDLNSENKYCKKHCCNTGLTILTSSKHIRRIYPHEILYIAIENRKSVVYLTSEKIETNYPFSFWKNVLNLKMFAQPHNSYIVNLMYVEEVTKEFVFLRYKEQIFRVYVSSRKFGGFKKALVNYQYM